MDTRRHDVIRDRGFSAEISSGLVQNASSRFAHSLGKMVSARERMDGADWADKYRIMPEASAYTRWSTARTPYLREIAECLSDNDPTHQVVVLRKSAQMGASEVALNEVLRRIHLDPCTILYFMESQEKVQGWMKERLDPALTKDPFSARKFNTTGLLRGYAGGQLVCNGIGSSSALSSVTAKLVVGDEAARYPIIIGGEGDFLSLARQRIVTYGHFGKIFLLSTALDTLVEEGTFMSYYVSGDQREFRCPCPGCGELYTWCLDQLKIIDGEAVMQCPACGTHTHDGDERMEATMAGAWFSTELPLVSDIVSFTLSAFVAPYQWRPWAKIWENYNNAMEGRAALSVFYNTVLGLPYDDADARTPSEEAIPKVMQVPKYRSKVLPKNVCVLTAAVDVQKTYLDVEVKGWGDTLENYSIERIKIEYPIDDLKNCYKELKKIITRKYKKTTGRGMSVCLTVIDEGYKAATVHKLMEMFKPPQVWRQGYGFIPHGAVTCTKGASVIKAENIILSIPGGKTIKRKRRVQKFWRIGTDIIKRELYASLNRMLAEESEEGDKPTGNKVVFARPHAPVDYDEDYFAELTAEKIVRRRNPKTGKSELIFYLPTGVANEALDLHVMNRAAAEILRLPDMTTKEWLHMKGREERRKTGTPPRTKTARQEQRQANLAKRRKLRAQRKGRRR